ncbi:MAG: type 1 glutamine amidotransferase domain-containing protein [Candidatus Izemoplasma sp.]|nr:type 1 glutamine amidotransferase domain-containing protein [Candidatus Izemoplasma sp.]
MKKVAILVANLFEDNELFYPYYRLQEAGYIVELIGHKAKQAYTSKHDQSTTSHKAVKDIKAADYDAVVIPGGYSPDYMRRSPDMIDFVKEMNTLKKPIAAICHGPWMMISSCDLTDKTLTGFYSIQDDIKHAGATYVDREVVVDDNLITSRTPNDLPVFVKTLIEQMA